jgi:hypothetical protein
LPPSPNSLKASQNESIFVHPKEMRFVQQMDSFVVSEPAHVPGQLQHAVKAVFPRVDDRQLAS